MHGAFDIDLDEIVFFISEVEGKRPKAPPNREIDLGACVAAGEGRCVTSPGPRCFLLLLFAFCFCFCFLLFAFAFCILLLFLLLLLLFAFAFCLLFFLPFNLLSRLRGFIGKYK